MRLHLIFFAFILIANHHPSFAQPMDAAVEMEETNILYRGYSNKIRVAVSNSEGGDIVLLSEDLEITAMEKQGYYAIRTIGQTRTASLSVCVVLNQDTTQVRTVNYRVMNLPVPDLCWGAAREGQPANLKETQLFLKYPPEIPLTVVFQIVEWELVVNDQKAQGRGHDLSEARKLLSSVTHSCSVQTTVKYLGPDGVKRSKTIVWSVDGWDDSPEPEHILKCNG